MCVTKPSSDCEAHRSTGVPLDVGTAAEFADRVAKRTTEVISLAPVDPGQATPVFTLMCEQPEVKEQHSETNMDSEVVDRFLKFLGFVHGRTTSTPVSVKDVLGAVANNEPLSQTDQVYIKGRLTWSVSSVAQWSNARQITPILRKLATGAEFDITSKLTKRNLADSRVYTITPR